MPDYSDDELLSMAESYGIKTKRPPQQEDFSDDELLGMAASYGIKTKPRKQKNNFLADTADRIVGGVEQFVPGSAKFFDANTQQAQERQDAGLWNDDYESAKRAATMLGAARVADGAINFVPNVIDQAMHVPAMNRRRYSDIARGLYDNSPEMQRLASEYPGTFEAQQGVSEAVTPLPGRAGEFIGKGILNKNVGTRLLDAFATQAGIGLGSTLENASRARREASNEELLTGAALGGVAGAALHGFGEAAGSLFDKWKAGRSAKIKPAESTSAPQDMFDVEQGIADNLDGEDLAAFNAMRSPKEPNLQPENGPLQGFVSSESDPLDSVLGEVETAGPLALKDAVDNAKQHIKNTYEGFDKEGRAQAEARLQQAIATNEDWQYRQAIARGDSGRFTPDQFGRARSLNEVVSKHPQKPVLESQPMGPQGLRFPDYLDFDQQAAFPKQSEQLKYPQYLDFEQGATHPRAQEQLQYPDYLDFAQAPKPQFRDVTRGGKYANLGVQLKGLAQRTQSALPAQPKQQRQYPDIDWGRPMPEPQPVSMSGLAYELDNLAGGNGKRLVGSVSQIEIAQAAIRNATPETIDQVIADAVKVVPKKGPAEYRNMANRKIDAAFNEYLERQGIKPEPKGARKKPAKNDPLLGLAKMKEASAASEVVPQIPAYQPKRSLSEQELFNLQQQEYAQFPNHKEPILIYNRGKGSGYSQRIQAQNLTDSQLDDALDYAQATMKMQSSKPHEKTRARQEERTIIEEKMRREMRKAQNLPEDWTGGQPDLDNMSRDQLGELVSNGDDNDPVVMEAANRLMQPEQAPVQQAPTVAGDFRRTMKVDDAGNYIKGNDRASTGGSLSALPEDAQIAVQRLAQSAIDRKSKELMIEQVAESLYRAGITDVGSIEVKDPTVNRVLNDIGEKLYQQARFDAASGVQPPLARGIRVQPGSIKGKLPELPKPPEQFTDAELLQMLSDFRASEREFKRNKEALNELYPKGEGLPDTTVQVDYNGQPVDVLVEREMDHQRLDIAEEKQAELSALMETLKQDPATSREKKYPAGLQKSRKSAAKVAKTAQTLLGVSLTAADNAALAAEEDKQEQKSAGGAMTLIGLALLGTTINPKVMQKAMKTVAGKAASAMGFLLADMHYSANYVDDLLQLKGDARLSEQMLKHNALTLMSQFGTKFASQEQKSFLFQLIRDGKVSVQEAMSGTGRGAQHFAALTQQQRNAITKYYLYSKSMANIVRNYRARMDYAIANGAPISRFQAGAIKRLDDALTPKVEPIDDWERFYLQVVRNLMDNYFRLNIEHTLLNMTDTIGMGAAHTGAVNMAKAWKDLATDKEIGKAFQDSNFFGNFRADHDDITRKMTQGTLNAPEKELDFGSDKFNADRVMLAAFYQRFQENAAEFKEKGLEFKDGKDFVKKLLAGKLDATITMDAWSHAGEAAMKTLGVDPLRLNKSGMERTPIYQVLVSFTAQPARMARLINQYAKEGRNDRIGYLMAASLLLGGGAAIPASIRYVGQQYFPQMQYELEKAANDLSLSGMLGNLDPELKPFLPSLDNKLGYDPLNPWQFGAYGSTVGTIGKTASDASALGDNIAAGKVQGSIDSGYRLAKDVGQTAVGRVGGIPVNLLFKGLETVNDTLNQQSQVNFYAGDKKIAESETLDLSEVPAGFLMPVVDKLLPGEPQIKREAYMNRKERMDYKRLNIEDDQFFSDPIKGLSKKTRDVKKERERTAQQEFEDLISDKLD